MCSLSHFFSLLLSFPFLFYLLFSLVTSSCTLGTSPRHSEVIVHLRNRGHDAYRHDVYGDTIVVERHIRSDGTGTYKLKSGSTSGNRGKANLTGPDTGSVGGVGTLGCK